jgi:hypothetical protein
MYRSPVDLTRLLGVGILIGELGPPPLSVDAVLYCRADRLAKLVLCGEEDAAVVVVVVDSMWRNMLRWTVGGGVNKTGGSEGLPVGNRRAYRGSIDGRAARGMVMRSDIDDDDDEGDANVTEEP